MKLHIVMPAINCFDLTEGAYNSIKKSTHSDCHFIFIDQDSNDFTSEWAKTMLKEDKHFTSIRNAPRVPVASAWNQGIRKAMEDPDCKYIGIFNNDIILHPKTLEHLMAFMDKTGYLMVTANNIAEMMSAKVMAQMELPRKFTDYDLWPISDWRAEGPDFSCFLISPETVRVIGYFDENFEGAYCEDWDYHRRIKAARDHIKMHNDQNIIPEKVHAKRLSTAPYYHYASETIKQNIKLRPEIAKMHDKNIAHYIQKWGEHHHLAMDGEGNVTPFGDAGRNWRDWR